MQVDRRLRVTRSNVFVLHGTKLSREGVARSIHSARPRPKGDYHQFDCARQAEELRLAIRRWASRDRRLGDSEAFLGDRGCTLFLDSVGALSYENQELLLQLVNRVAETSLVGEACPLGRLVVGSPLDLQVEVGSGRFHPQLYDSLDKIRVDLRAVGDREEVAR